MPQAFNDDTSLPVYRVHPPEWLPKTHNSGDLGYPNFHPPRPGQDEDILSEANVKNGFILAQAVTAETYSSQASITENLHSVNTIHKLEDLMNEVFARRASRIPSVPPSTFHMPSRVTLNDAKRQAWFDDLANADVPLAKLGRNVPHGAKGADLIELLYSKNVAIHRAVWFLRVFGANETAGLRNKPSYNPTQYSIEWTNVVTAHLRKQLMEIALPSAPRAGVNIKQTFKRVLADSETRSKWVSRFSYCLQLLRLFYSEGLIDKQTFFSWLVNQMFSCNLAQVGFVSRLADEYFDGMIECRPLTRPFTEGSLCKLSEINTSAAKVYLADTEYLIKFLLQRVCLVLPDTFVSPKMWITHFDIICEVLTRSSNNFPDGSVEQAASSSIFNIIYRNFLDIKRRVEAMLFRNLPSLSTSPHLGSAVHDVELLNSISADTDVLNLPFFPSSSENLFGISEKLDALLTWSVTPLQYGDHRAFVAVTLIQQWRTKAGDRANRRDASPPDEFLQDQLFEWLDSSDVSGETANIAAVALLYGRLVKHELFSYASYIQRLIARGEPGLSFNEDIESRHRSYLRWIPLYNTTPSLTSQRKVVLYGVRARKTPEDVNEREIRKEIRAVLPELFGGTVELELPSPASLLKSCQLLLQSPRYEQVRTFGTWLMPVLQKAIVQQEFDVSHSGILKSYGVAVELMTQTDCFDAMLDLTIYMLEHCSTEELLLAIIDTFRRHAVIWASMDVKGLVITTLDSVHHSWKMRGIQSRPLLALLVEFDGGKYLSDMSRDEIRTDLAAFTLALQPAAHHPDSVPDVLPEILYLVNNPACDAPSTLANGLWIKYRMTLDWAWKVWDNTIASLRQIPFMTFDDIDRRTRALRYGVFLHHVNRHLANGLDDQVLGWFLGRGMDEVAVLSQEVWDIVKVVLLYLVVQGALRTTTILEGLVWPAWRLAASLSEEHGPSLEVHLGAANDICRRLLLREDCSSDMIPPTNLLEVHCLRTRRQDVYREPYFPSMIANIPTLVSLENNTWISEQLRRDAQDIRQSLCEDKLFRQGVFRNLDAVRRAFEQSMQIAEGNGDDVFKPTIAALSMILGESTKELELSHWPDSASLLSPWKISATAIQLQFVLRQMGRSNTVDTKGTADSAALDKLTTMIFHHTLSSEEASFVAQMTKGVGSEIAGKFINNGLKHVAEIIHNMDFASDSLHASVGRAGELLRVLIYVAEPLRDNPSELPLLDSTVQTEFFEALSTKFADLVVLLQAEDVPTKMNDIEPLMHVCVLLARFLQFDLAFRGVWTEPAKKASEALSSNLFILTQIYASGNNSELIAYPLLLDTLFYLRDEMPSDHKMGTFDPFQHYPDISLSTLPLDLAPEFRKKLLSLLPKFTGAASVQNLSHAHRDAHGSLVIDTAVMNRPWEWTENIGEPAVDPGQIKGSFQGREVVKNTGSLNLLAFGARMTGEGILPETYQEDARMQENFRTFEDGFSAESIFQRDWRETRVKPSNEDLLEVSKTRVDAPANATSHSRNDRQGTSKNSPVMSTSGSGISRQSPGHSTFTSLSNSTISDIIDVDILPVTTGGSSYSVGKRKAATTVESDDDEVEFVSGPVSTKSGKKTKSTKSTKSQAKKSTKRR
ncbi:hypothetical protein BDP27DRAFT_1419656 [Rhodocollybia butyracea]|uniref:Mediator of RNA polymerase II transcription subunit 12 n=1 Tax=Rhodocollybia butyracea TaxID=206335 RepID=A0A9P5U9E5_9AGAR|nr:hypothetical protein BDP27DRAFT_1419656 [Rhodocollybia butyracea]